MLKVFALFFIGIFALRAEALCLQTLLNERGARPVRRLRAPLDTRIRELESIFLPLAQEASIAHAQAKAIATAEANPEFTLRDLASNLSIDTEYQSVAERLREIADPAKREAIAALLSTRPLTYATFTDALSIFLDIHLGDLAGLFPISIFYVHTDGRPIEDITKFFGGLGYPLLRIGSAEKLRAHNFDLDQVTFLDHEYFHAVYHLSHLLPTLWGRELRCAEIDWRAVVRWQTDWHRFTAGWAPWAERLPAPAVPRLRATLFFYLLHDDAVSPAELLKTKHFDVAKTARAFVEELSTGEDLAKILGSDRVDEATLLTEFTYLLEYTRTRAPDFPDFVRP